MPGRVGLMLREAGGGGAFGLVRHQVKARGPGARLSRQGRTRTRRRHVELAMGGKQRGGYSTVEYCTWRVPSSHSVSSKLDVHVSITYLYCRRHRSSVRPIRWIGNSRNSRKYVCDVRV